MSAGRLPTDELVLDTLIERALAGLDTDAEASLRRGPSAADAEAFDQAVASLTEVFATTDESYEPMPTSIANAVENAIRDEQTRVPKPGPALRLSGDARDLPARTGSNGWAIAGWLSAAACLTLAVAAWWPSSSTTTNLLTTAQQYDQLAASDGVVKTSWIGLDDVELTDDPHPLDQQLAGEVIWDPEAQQGYMKFTGLAVNDADEFQYQLWIFDASRRTGDLPQFAIEGFPDLLTQRPVDGGVFDSTTGEVIIPIDAKLPVGQAAIFAITKEPPGGVVVSDRDIVTLAIVQ